MTKQSVATWHEVINQASEIKERIDAILPLIPTDQSDFAWEARREVNTAIRIVFLMDGSRQGEAAEIVRRLAKDWL